MPTLKRRSDSPGCAENGAAEAPLEHARKKRIVQLIQPLQRLSFDDAAVPPPMPGDKAGAAAEADVAMRPASTSYWKDAHTVVVESLEDSDDEERADGIELLPDVSQRIVRIPRSVLEHSAPAAPALSPVRDMVLFRRPDSYSAPPLPAAAAAGPGGADAAQDADVDMD